MVKIDLNDYHFEKGDGLVIREDGSVDNFSASKREDLVLTPKCTVLVYQQSCVNFGAMFINGTPVFEMVGQGYVTPIFNGDDYLESFVTVYRLGDKFYTSRSW